VASSSRHADNTGRGWAARTPSVPMFSRR
jgi:hypothetical protein